MPKKYRLKINYSEITEENIEIAASLKFYDNKTCEKVEGGYKFSDVNFISQDIIKDSWLTEIKVPLTFEEWYRIDSLNEGPISREDFEYREKIWNAALENQKIGLVDKEKDAQAHKKFLDETDIFVEPRLWDFTLKYAWEGQ